ncbi:transcriptional regulator (plasmid) [Rhizobium lusitanum]|uniref:helix-turn-helix domain-containing protein n=1 Tax=Rhizobium lusitanum TaxID=293958 RepID=UPI001614B78E|nr:helix-turn-helix domain-containing protein [Rhizobium lusitanum]QND45339.1 transcriptional regulator [Rhizobium lusitanum]
MTTTKKWDRRTIKEELLRQNKTLTGIARDAGLYDSACRAGMIGASRPGAEAIAKALGVPFREMFPDSYTLGRHDDGETSSNNKQRSSQKRDAAADRVRGAA